MLGDLGVMAVQVFLGSGLVVAEPCSTRQDATAQKGMTSRSKARAGHQAAETVVFLGGGRTVAKAPTTKISAA